MPARPTRHQVDVIDHRSTSTQAHLTAGELFQPTLAEVDEALGKHGPKVHLQLLEPRRVIDAIAARGPWDASTTFILDALTTN